MRVSFVTMLIISLLVHGGGVIAASSWHSSQVVVQPAEALKISMHVVKPQPRPKQQVVQPPQPPEPPKPKKIEEKPKKIAKKRGKPTPRKEVVERIEEPQPVVEEPQPLPPQPQVSPPAISVAYEQALAALLEKHKFYPRRARRRRLEGEGVIELEIARSGRLLKAVVIDSTGSAVLDRAIERIVERAEPLPPLPAEYLESTMNVRVPLSFALKD